MLTLVTTAAGAARRRSLEGCAHRTPAGVRDARTDPQADIILFQGHALDLRDRPGHGHRTADVYDPMVPRATTRARRASRAVGGDEQATEPLREPRARTSWVRALERQRDLDLAEPAALWGLTPDTHAQGHGSASSTWCRSASCGGGSGQDPPALRGVIPAIGDDDRSSSGAAASTSGSTRSPSCGRSSCWSGAAGGCTSSSRAPASPPGVPEMPVVRPTKDVAVQLGLLDRLVHFNEPGFRTTSAGRPGRRPTPA